MWCDHLVCQRLRLSSLKADLLQGHSSSGHRGKAASLRQQEDEELQMALAVSASEAAAVAAALQEPISIEDAEVMRWFFGMTCCAVLAFRRHQPVSDRYCDCLCVVVADCIVMHMDTDRHRG